MSDIDAGPEPVPQPEQTIDPALTQQENPNGAKADYTPDGDAPDAGGMAAAEPDPTQPATGDAAAAGDGETELDLGDAHSEDDAETESEPQAEEQPEPEPAEEVEPDHAQTINDGLANLAGVVHQAVATELASVPTVQADDAAARVHAKIDAAIQLIREAWAKLNSPD